MKKGKITGIGIEYNYGFYNGGFLKYKIGKKEYYWYSKKGLIEAICMEFGIYMEKDMYKLNNRRFNILKIEEFEDGSAKYEIEIVNKKINPDKKSVWIYDNV